jgi:hypothetical protein
MKYTLTTAALVLAMTAAADAATLWQGDMFISTATSACSSVGTNAGDFVQAVFAPKKLQGNSTTSDQFAIFRPRGSAAQIVPKSGTLNGATTFTLTVIENAAVHTISETTSPITVSPATITATTPTVTITWAQAGWDTTGCNVTLQGILARRPGSLPN